MAPTDPSSSIKTPQNQQLQRLQFPMVLTFNFSKIGHSFEFTGGVIGDPAEGSTAAAPPDGGIQQQS